jgi:hypothetical protein
MARSLALAVVLIGAGSAVHSPRLTAGVADVPFVQEVHVPHPLPTEGANDVRAIEVDTTGAVWAATAIGVYVLRPGAKEWALVLDQGPAYAVALGNAGSIWIGAWDGLYRVHQDGVEKVKGIAQPVSVLCSLGDSVMAFGPDGAWCVRDGKVVSLGTPYSKAPRDAVPDGEGGFWLATEVGLYHQRRDGLRLFRGPGQLVSANARALAFAPDGTLWIGGLGGIMIYRGERPLRQIRPKDGLPSAWVECVERGPDGRMWVGTRQGISRIGKGGYSVRHSRRWLLSDDVRDIAFGPDGTAWIATASGVSAIVPKPMTLAEKAAHFLHVCYRRHLREPYLVEQCLLPVPGDTSRWEPMDTDNDGLFTGMYLAMESFRYASTQDSEARERAHRAFEALRFLQEVTGTPGFVARTVIPATWKRMADPNRRISEHQWADMHVANPREKRVEQRWRLSRDKKWLWKGDTSSDEITGHMFGYHCFYRLAADDATKPKVRDQVCRIVDYIIDGGYVLRDLDGTHTKWGVWSPELLNGDPDWITEQGINSVEILAYLKLAHHLSGNEKYQQEYLRLLRECGYAENVRYAKTVDPAWRTHIDDNLLAQAYLILFDLETDADLLALYRQSIDWWYEQVRDEGSPFFDFVYAACIKQQPVQLERDIEYFRDTPLDLVCWTIDNSRREDVELVRRPELEQLQTARLLPPSERGLMRWDRNPWQAVWGDGGRTERPGTAWLLPYWMGRYYGWID